jgi:SOS response regulatory protein OraA/RecX
MPLLGPPSLKGRALRLLSGREHSRAELERKLAAHEEEPGQLKRVLDELQAKDFINEQRVVDSVVYRRSGKLGAMRIRQELQSKGLDAEKVQMASPGSSRRNWRGRARSGAGSSTLSRAMQRSAASRPAFWPREDSTVK